MGAQKMSIQRKEGLMGSFASTSNYVLSQQLSTSHAETLEQESFPHAQEHKDFTLDPQQMSLSSKQSHKEPWPKVITLSPTQEGATQAKSQNADSDSVRLQKSPLKNKRVTHTEPPPKSTTESVETVRSKMRESLAASLSLACNDQMEIKIVQNCSSETSSTHELDKIAKNGELCSVTMTNPAPCQDLEPYCETHAGHNLQKQVTVVVSSTVSSTFEMTTYNSETLKCDEMNSTQNGNRGNFVEDEFLMQNGLSWSCVDHEECEVQENPDSYMQKSTDDPVNEHFNGNCQTLATIIEAELFKLFGGVNKKYKEKGRSLLFNLRDQNNPELRKRVVSGEIVPKRLCSMTVEELASKELSEWRIAKAEELAQMVVLPDSELDLKHLVKKTHKGEIQVEVEQDNISVEVEVGANSSPPSRTRKRKSDLEHQLTSNGKIKKGGSQSREDGAEKMFISPGKTNLGEDTLTSLLHDSVDYVQDFMVDEFREVESLPPAPTFDELMRDLDSEPPFGNLSVEALQDTTIADESKSESTGIRVHTESDGAKSKLDDTAMPLDSKPIHVQDGSESRPVNANGNATKADASTIDANASYKNTKHVVTLVNSEHAATHIKATTTTDKHVWDGLIQLNTASLVTVLGFYKSGEQISVNNWPSFLEIKGRVRLDAFEKFLQELNLSRRRGIMIMQFAWKQGSPESGRLKLRETIDSYVANERVGFAEPVAGVELYFCSPHPKTSRVISKNLPKEHGDDKMIPLSIDDDDGLVGIVVWRRPAASFTSPKQLHSDEKHGSRQQQHSLSGKNMTGNTDGTSVASVPTSPDDGDDDIPPGFGPATASRDDDDLPEFDFVQGETRAPSACYNCSMASVPDVATATVRAPLAHVVEQIRQMIHKYGQDESANKSQMGIVPWNDVDDDDDDIPEWRPSHLNRYQRQLNTQNQTYTSRQQHVRHPMHPPATATFPYPGLDSRHWRRRPAPLPRRYAGPLLPRHRGPRGFV